MPLFSHLWNGYNSLYIKYFQGVEDCCKVSIWWMRTCFKDGFTTLWGYELYNCINQSPWEKPNTRGLKENMGSAGRNLTQSEESRQLCTLRDWSPGSDAISIPYPPILSYSLLSPLSPPFLPSPSPALSLSSFLFLFWLTISVWSLASLLCSSVLAICSELQMGFSTWQEIWSQEILSHLTLF